MKKKLVLLAAAAVLPLTMTGQTRELKPRLVVMTDIAPADVEPDDNESAVRLLAYADRFEIEAICTTVGWNCDPYPAEWAEYLDRVIDAYEKDVRNLMKRSGQKSFQSLQKENGKQRLGYWPSAEYLRSRAMKGSQRAGIDVIGEGNDSPGSDFLIQLAQENDPRPIWVASWGGSNTLAQAIWRYKQTASPEELSAFVRKFRIYTITDQDMYSALRRNLAYSSHQWLRREFQDDLLFIWDEATWRGQNSMGAPIWDKYVSFVQGCGELGKVYPTYKHGVEGDTPSFLHLMPNGLNDPDDPAQAGWGGYHLFGITPDGTTYAWTNWEKPMSDISTGYDQHFYPDAFNDFAARMAWAEYGRGNTNPVVIVDGKRGIAPVSVKARAGEEITLDASRSKDAEGDGLTFHWWQQAEAGTLHSPVDIQGADTSKACISLPAGSRGETLHIICEVHDDGPFQLVSYRRIIVHIE